MIDGGREQNQKRSDLNCHWSEHVLVLQDRMGSSVLAFCGSLVEHRMKSVYSLHHDNSILQYTTMHSN